MTRDEFLAALRQRLSGLPKEELDAAIQYYSDYFDDAPSPQEAARQLGSPESVAEGIWQNRPSFNKPPENKKRSAWFYVGISVLLLFSLPITLPVAAAAVGVAFGLLMALLGVIVAVIAPFFACAVAFAGCFFLFLYLTMGAVGVFWPGAVFLFGAALLCGGLAIFSGVFTGYLCLWTGLLLKKLFQALKWKKGKKESKAQ